VIAASPKIFSQMINVLSPFAGWALFNSNKHNSIT
jgi:hypothetical protein